MRQQLNTRGEGGFQWVLTLAFLLLFAGGIFAQETQEVRTCSAHEHLHDQMKSDPQMSVRRAALEAFTARFSDGKTSQMRGVITIPVVVHVLYNTSANNISDEQIFSQIRVLNEDYRRRNFDASQTPVAFANIAADTEIEFCLAQRTPDGKPTNGITRTETTKTFFTSRVDDIKRSSQGGKDPCDSSQYLNIWVAPSIRNASGSRLLGYAQFPGGSAETDGVVIAHNYFGTTGTATTAPFNRGRTATHEVGHWLNLYHIWGDDGDTDKSNNTTSSYCDGTDYVADTPNQSEATYGCPSFPKLDGCTGANFGVLYSNYMDYTNDECMNTFTKGQKSRMLAVLNSTRFQLINSLGCQPPSEVQAQQACHAPKTSNLLSVSAKSVTISWAAAANALLYKVKFRLAGTVSWTNVSPTATTNITLSNLTAAKAYQYQISTLCASGESAPFDGAFTTPNEQITSQIAQNATCANSYEDNNTFANAKEIHTNNVVNSMLGTSNDIDWFKFTVSAATKNIKIVLSNLPDDFDMKLYSVDGQLVTTSQNSRKQNETIFQNNLLGTYFVRIYGFNGVFSNIQCYQLEIQTNVNNSRDEFSEIAAQSNDIKNTVVAYPNPTNGLCSLEFLATTDALSELTIFDQLGALVHQQQYTKTIGLNQLKIDMTHLPNGIYWVRLNDNENNNVQKIIKQ